MHRDHHKSWISPRVTPNTPLLFVSDSATSDVYIFDLTTLGLVGMVSGFTDLGSLCSDASGNVWVVNNVGIYQSYIVELSHTGNYLTEVYDPGNSAACAVDPSTNELAIANYNSIYSGCGDVLVYHLPSQYYPTTYTNPALGCVPYLFAGYDRHDNLFVDGWAGSPLHFALSKLPVGASSLETINVKGATIYFPGGIQWYPGGHYLVVGDQQCGGNFTTCLYWVKAKGTTGQIAGVTHLYNPDGSSVCDVAQAAIGKTASRAIVAGGDIEGNCNYRSSTSINVWPFPGGGLPNVTNTVAEIPIGAAISK